MSRMHFLSLITIISSVAVSSPASAVTLVDDDDHKIELHGLVRSRLSADINDGGPVQPGASILMARLMAQAQYKNLGSMMLHLESVTAPAVLDAFVDINMGSPVGLTVGKLRMPLSRELLINIPVLPIYDRALLSNVFAPRRRVGAMAHGTVELSSLTFLMQFGVFNPTSTLQAGQDGLLMLGSLDITHRAGLNFHVAAMSHVLEPDAAAVPMGVTYPSGEQLDVALFYDSDHLRVLAEGALIKPEVAGDELPYGLHGFVAYKFSPEGQRFAYEPALSVDVINQPGGEDIQRMTANMNWLLHDRNLQASLGYGLESRAALSHKMLVGLQASF